MPEVSSEREIHILSKAKKWSLNQPEQKKGYVTPENH